VLALASPRASSLDPLDARAGFVLWSVLDALGLAPRLGHAQAARLVHGFADQLEAAGQWEEAASALLFLQDPMQRCPPPTAAAFAASTTPSPSPFLPISGCLTTRTAAALTLPYLTLPYLTLPYLTLPYLTLPYLT